MEYFLCQKRYASLNTPFVVHKTYILLTPINQHLKYSIVIFVIKCMTHKSLFMPIKPGSPPGKYSPTPPSLRHQGVTKLFIGQFDHGWILCFVKTKINIRCGVKQPQFGTLIRLGVGKTS